MSLQPLLFIDLLADRQMNPAAAALTPASGETDALLPLLASDAFFGFCSSFPCVVEEHVASRLSQAFIDALLSAGGRVLAAEETPFHSDDEMKPALPPAASWLTGRWYLAPPPSTQGLKATPRTLSLKLLQLVATDADTCEIESIFRQDPILAYHLLRLVNSIGVGVGRHVSSFAQAILILGRQQLKRWLNLMLFAASHDDHRSGMLLARVSVRARSMELLAKASGLDRSTQEQAFMAGMFSLLGTLFGMPLPELLDPLRLNDSVSNAVLRHEHALGNLLTTIELAERNDARAVIERLSDLGVSPDEFNLMTIEAHHWMSNIIHDKQDPTDA